MLRKFDIGRNNNKFIGRDNSKVDPIETGIIVYANLTP